jgi:alanyl-tRNA synthetase
MEEAQTLATRIFLKIAVHILTTTRGSCALGVQQDSQRDGEIRVIDVEGCDGRPARRMSEHGINRLIFVLDWNAKSGTRVEFAPAASAEGLRKFMRFGRGPSLLVSRGLPAFAEKLLQERMVLNRENELLRDRVLEMEAAELIQNGTKTEHSLRICRAFTDRKLEAIKALATKLTAKDGVVAVLGIADTCQIVVSRSRNLQGNCGEAIKKIASELGGKGGGRPEIAQAGGFAPDAFNAWMAALENYFSS